MGNEMLNVGVYVQNIVHNCALCHLQTRKEPFNPDEKSNKRKHRNVSKPLFGGKNRACARENKATKWEDWVQSTRDFYINEKTFS